MVSRIRRAIATKPVAIFLEPGVAAVTRIDVENVEAGNRAGGNSDKGPGIK
jgi:hypothetical protein